MGDLDKTGDTVKLSNNTALYVTIGEDEKGNKTITLERYNPVVGRKETERTNQWNCGIQCLLPHIA